MKSMCLCADDTSALLSRTSSGEHLKLLQKFVSGDVSERQTDADRLKSAVIQSYFEILPVSYYYKLPAICKEADVFRTVIDCAKMDRGILSDFDDIIPVRFDELDKLRNSDETEIKNHNRHWYNRIQMMLLCSGLRSGNLAFVGVESFVPEHNIARELSSADYAKIRIRRDNKTIEKIKERGAIFGQIRRVYVTIGYYDSFNDDEH